MKNKYIEQTRTVRSSYDAEKREIEVVFVTETPVLMRTWDGAYMEVLTMEGGDFSRLENGGPFLNNHNRFEGHNAVLGKVTEIKTEPGRAIAKIKISGRKDLEGFRKDLEDGILSGISIGYRVYEYEKEDAPKGEIPTYRATKWEGLEISYAPVQADPESRIRREDSEAQKIHPNSIVKMKDQTKEKERAAEPAHAETLPITAPNPSDDLTSQRAAIDAARAAEVARIKAIRELCDLAGANPEKFVSEGAEIDAVRSALIAEKASQTSRPVADVRSGKDGDDKIREAMRDGLFARATGYAPESAAPGWEAFRGLSLTRMAGQWLGSRGVDTAQMSNVQIARMAMNRRAVGYHSSSDFPILLTETIQRTLRAQYASYPATFAQFCRRESFPDFRAQTRAQISGMIGGLDEIPEGGEYKSGTFKEAGETYSVAKYGKLIHLTWEALVNDDLSAFNRAPAAMAQRARQLQSELVYGILSGNPEMADGEDLFSAAHGNLATSGAAISVETLSAARLAMRRQTDLNGQPIWVQPSFLVTSPENETTAEQVLNLLTVPITDATTNPFKQSLQIIADPYLTGDAWYLSAAPGAVDTIEYAFLDGEELYTDTQEGFEVDGVSLKIRMIFGTKAIDHRGLYKNPGA